MKKIFLEYHEVLEERPYKVVKVINAIEPLPGQYLSTARVKDFCELRMFEVTITEGKAS